MPRIRLGLRRSSRVRHGLTAVLLAVALTACGADDGGASEAPGEQPDTAAASPTAVPGASGEVRTRGAVTVLETDAGPVACLGPVALSDPPQCTGQALEDWRWSEHPEHQRSQGVRWGAFELQGSWDGTTLRVTDAVPADDAEPAEGDETDLATPCPEPDDGWVVDPSRAGDRALDATLTAAGRLIAHAETWVDPANDVLNVRVTEDVEGAESELRRTWGGGLCVTEAEYGEDELVDLAGELQELPGILSTSAHADVVTVDVVHDDGTVQEWADAKYGEGRVEVRSALEPV